MSQGFIMLRNYAYTTGRFIFHGNLETSTISSYRQKLEKGSNSVRFFAFSFSGTSRNVRYYRNKLRGLEILKEKMKRTYQ
jgi:hypothetical protein